MNIDDEQDEGSSRYLVLYDLVLSCDDDDESTVNLSVRIQEMATCDLDQDGETLRILHQLHFWKRRLVRDAKRFWIEQPELWAHFNLDACTMSPSWIAYSLEWIFSLLNKDSPTQDKRTEKHYKRYIKHFKKLVIGMKRQKSRDELERGLVKHKRMLTSAQLGVEALASLSNEPEADSLVYRLLRERPDWLL
jgi:hypothetical protein